MGNEMPQVGERVERLAAAYPTLCGWIRQAQEIARLDAEMALTRSRKVLEYVVRQTYESRVGEPSGTRPLENLLQRLAKDEHLPKLLVAYSSAVRELGNVGTHSFSEPIHTADVEQSLAQLLPVVEWYAAQDFAKDPPRVSAAPAAPSTPTVAGRSEPAASSVHVVPKGLRSFDRSDRDFFFELLPGPRGRDGLPPWIHFWKERIEDTAEVTFTVGLMYGPSGCGKSSLVKAGLLPHLSAHVQSVFVESTADETEARLLQGLRQRFPQLPADVNLHDGLLALRTSTILPAGQKVLLVLDQFEQWLHATRTQDNSGLVSSLRQCDGTHVQAIILVRDDFWLAVSRFLADLDVRLAEGENATLVDLFDLLHARKVLALFGRAFGRLPPEPAPLTTDQNAFLDQAIAGLAQDNKIVPVRLSLFAEMVKGRPWTPDTLRAVGGMEGLGVTFLEETFVAASAPADQRLHQAAARGVLQGLLPEAGAEIKGHRQSLARLLAASGYVDRPREFHELLRILDTRLRLITPADSAGPAPGDGPDSGSLAAEAGTGQYYQLTHDFLVPALRDWLTRQQRETRRGRAELALAERAAAWNPKRDERHLPSMGEWLRIRFFTRPRDWTAPQRQMLRTAGRYYGLRGGILAAAMGVLLVAIIYFRAQSKAQHRATVAAGLVERLLDAETARVPDVIHEINDQREEVEPLLRDALADVEQNEEPTLSPAERAQQRRRHLHLSLALLPSDSAQAQYLYERLLTARPEEVPVLIDALEPHQEQFVERLWDTMHNTESRDKSQRLRAACALARYDAKQVRWQTLAPALVDDLVTVNPTELAVWIEGLRPVKKELLVPLEVKFHAVGEDRAAKRALATSIFTDYASDNPALLTRLTLDADEHQFPILFPLLAEHGNVAASLFAAAENSGPSDYYSRDEAARRRANAGIVLLLAWQPQAAWPILAQTPDCSARSYLTHRLAAFDVKSQVVIEALARENNPSIRSALLLALGEFAPSQLQATQRQILSPQLLEWYRDDPDPGVHGATAWLLRTWDKSNQLKEVDDQLATGGIDKKRLWYVNRERQTFSIVRGPVEFTMGSPPDEPGRGGGREGKTERPHTHKVEHSFAIGAREITVAEFLRFRPEHEVNKQYARSPDCPVNNVSNQDTAAYCNWLSERDQIPKEQWCYEPGEKEGELKLVAEYARRTGYRLPSEAEWEFSCRASTTTLRYYGIAEELLPKYAWFVKGSGEDWTIPVGRLKPNDLGLFDMLGNAWERCLDGYTYYPPDSDPVTKQNANGTFDQVMRGGSIYRVLSLRCADREGVDPAQRHNYIGFRVARSLP